ncbi:hypothetical protein CMV_020353 [Castanea mollissima]|uniref:Glycolipid transfer protein domain-containing protein n=1 Tax=Castanea mollissima TaxID=60419 RepID=A0A8J4QYR1_9ROSI|nr:hypothetical protein CMV_020353 [Castanea mollissima]
MMNFHHCRSVRYLCQPEFPEKGTVTLEYKISNTGGAVCHGTLSGDVVSFIRYDTIEKAQMSQSLLQRLRTAEFVNPLVVMSSKPNVWLVVPKIDSTLDQFKKKNTGIWSCDDLLDDKYKIIVRDIIAGVIQLVNHGYMGELKIQDIAIINGRAKLMRISNELGVSKLRDQLQNLLEDLLGNDPNNKELIDFYSHLKPMQMCKLIHLRNHPILLTSQEKLQFPVLLPLLLNYEKKSSNWRAKYDCQYRDEEVKKAKKLEKDQEYKVVYEYKSDQKREVNYIATKVEKDQDYKNMYEYRIYPNTASSQIDFPRNTIRHINDDGQCTVESKFLQDQFKYRKLEGIFKDDNVCSTSTKLAENSCTNCINFLMRFLKFIALFLHKYAQNADGDVKGMFETAYSSLLEDDPNLKKKRKEESLKKHTNLLESVPSNEEFKSLLGNPKNIKDCGISVAESLTILTDIWDKLSNKKNANKKQGVGGGIVATTSAAAVTETTARAGEAVVVAASSGDLMVAATSVGDSTAGGGTTSQRVEKVKECSPRRRRRRRNLNLSTCN